MFARVCKGWRRAQRKVGGPLRTRVASDVVLPGQVALVKWALAEGRPRDGKVEPFEGFNMAEFAADAGRFELVQGLLLEGGFQLLDKQLLGWAQGARRQCGAGAVARGRRPAAGPRRGGRRCREWPAGAREVAVRRATRSALVTYTAEGGRLLK